MNIEENDRANFRLVESLNKPFEEKDRLDFIVEYNHKRGYIIEENDEGIYAFDYSPEEKQRQEKERILTLSLTKREVFLALFKDKGITPEEIKSKIDNQEALIEFEYANEYYRANPLVNLIGEKLGYNSGELDYLFENGTLPDNSTLEESGV